MDASRRNRRAYLALVVGALGIGMAPLFVRWIHVHYEVGPTAIAFWRMLFALPVFALALGLQRRSLATPPVPGTAPVVAPSGPGLWWVVAAGLFFAVDLTLWHWSLLLSSIANATLLSNLAPVFVAIGAAVLFSQPCSRWFAVALALTVAGGVCLVSSSADLGREHLLGDALAAGSAVAYAAYLLAVSRLRRRFDALAIMTWSGAAAAAAFLVIAVVSGERFVPLMAEGWLALLAFSLVAQIFGQGLIVYALDVVPASFTSVTLLIQPVIATLLAWPLFDERVGPLQAVGAAVVLAGILMAKRS